MRGDGAQSATIATQITSGVGDQSIGVNLPRKTWTNSFGLERSEWGVGELITWNRALSQPEMQRTMDYFTRVLSGGTPYRQSINTTVASQAVRPWVSEDAKYSIVPTPHRHVALYAERATDPVGATSFPQATPGPSPIPQPQPQPQPHPHPTLHHYFQPLQ